MHFQFENAIDTYQECTGKTIITWIWLFLLVCQKASNIFNRGADLPERAIAESDSVSEDDMQHFYDDFFEVGPPDSDQCENCLDASLAMCV